MQVRVLKVTTKLNYAGFRRFRLHPLSQTAVMARARRIAAAAGAGFVAESRNSPQRARAVVYPDTPEAQRRDLKELTLIRSIGAGR